MDHVASKPHNWPGSVETSKASICSLDSVPSSVRDQAKPLGAWFYQLAFLEIDF